MSLSKNRVRWAAAIVAVAAVALAAACEPVKKSPPKDAPPTEPAPKPGENIAGYFAINGDTPSDANTTRSPSPFRAGFGQATASQALNPDGSVSLIIDVVDTPTEKKTTGFNMKFRRVGDFGGIGVHLVSPSGSDEVALWLWFDVNGDGVFSFASDKVAFGPSTVAGALSIDDEEKFQFPLEPGAPSFTLFAVAGGDKIEGINADTPMSLVIALTSPGVDVDILDVRVDSVTVNNVEILVP